ncbi:Right handed beta helix region [Thermoactinomyces sp. DSM 45891]|nr:Right handed beta helix region [Thermoactinomyces sp. DSM 45891]
MQVSRISVSKVNRTSYEQNDIGRFQRAISALRDGGELTVPSGTYYLDSLTIEKSIHIRCAGVVEFIPTAQNKDILIIEGTRNDASYHLLEPANRRDPKITLSSNPSDIKPGDMIVVTDDSVRYKDHHTDLNTEVHEVFYVENNTIWLRDYIRLPKSPAPSGVNVYKVNPIENVKIDGFRYRMLEGSTCGRGIYANYVRNLQIMNIQGTRGAGSGVQVRKAIQTRVERFEFTNPQVVGGGQGYGVQFFGGCNGITVRDGYTYGMRHSVDLEGSCEALIDNVVDVCAAGASFLLSHNGYSSDVTIQNCRAIHSAGTGIVADSQAISSGNPDKSSPLQLTFYGFQIRNCEIINFGFGNAGIHFYSPCKEVFIEGCKIRYRSGSEKGLSKLSNAGIRLYPAQTDAQIHNCTIEGYRRGISFQSPAGDYDNRDDCQVHISNTVIRNCCSALFFNYGRSKRFQISHIHCEEIEQQFLELNQGDFTLLQIDDVTIIRSPKLRFANHKIQMTNKKSAGAVRNILIDDKEFSPLPHTL